MGSGVSSESTLPRRWRREGTFPSDFSLTAGSLAGAHFSAKCASRPISGSMPSAKTWAAVAAGAVALYAVREVVRIVYSSEPPQRHFSAERVSTAPRTEAGSPRQWWRVRTAEGEIDRSPSAFTVKWWGTAPKSKRPSPAACDAISSRCSFLLCAAGYFLCARYPCIVRSCHVPGTWQHGTCSGRIRLVHPGGNPGANRKSISHRCHPILVAFVWELTAETIDLPWVASRADQRKVTPHIAGRQVSHRGVRKALAGVPQASPRGGACPSSSLLLSSQELSDTTIYEP